MSPRLMDRDRALIAAGAVLSTLAYPPFELVVPAFIHLIPAGLLVLDGSGAGPRRLLHQGFWYGAVTHAVLLHWLVPTLWVYSPPSVLLYPVAAVIFGGAYAVMFAAVGASVRRRREVVLLAFPVGIVTLEWLAGQTGPLAFPWHQAALTLTGSTALLQGADVLGTEGLALALALVNAALALAWHGRSRRSQVVGCLGLSAITIGAMAIYGVLRLRSLVLVPGAVAAVVQPNASVAEKWQPRARDGLVDRTMRLTAQVLDTSSASFVAWPETALPDGLDAHPGWYGRVTRLARRSGSTILVGAVDVEATNSGASRSFNAAFAFPLAAPRPSVTPAPVHRKQRLVPLVERAFVTRSERPAYGFGHFRAGGVPTVANSPAGRYGTLLCYELTFPEMARALRRQGADFLVTLSNDAWLGRTAAPHQHFAHAKLRAVENRVTVVRAANSGISGIVDPLGRVVARTGTFVEASAAGVIQWVARPPLASWIGGWTGPAALVLLGLSFVWGAMGRDGSGAGEPTTTRRVPWLADGA